MDQGLPDQLSLKHWKFVLTELLVVIILSTLLLWYLQFLWSRRKLYQAASKLPGPFSLPVIGSTFYFLGYRNDPFDQLNRFFQHYPGLFKVWFGTSLYYFVSDPKYLEPLLTNQQALKKMELYKFLDPLTGEGLAFAPVNIWKKHRRLIQPSFNKKILDGFVEIFVEKSEFLVKIMEKYTGKLEIDILDLMSRCTLYSITETTLGVKSEAQTSDTDFHAWVIRVGQIISIRMSNIFYHSDIIFDNSPLGKSFYDLADRIRSFTKQILTDKIAKYKMDIQQREKNYKEEIFKRKGILDILIELNYEQDEHLRITDEALLDETITFIIAGFDTTATTKCFVLTMLGMHPDIQDKVLAEILDVIGPDREVEASDLPQLKYLERVIRETLRLFPILPNIGRSLDEDITLGDHVLQKGCSVIVGIFTVHRNETYWPDPYKFNPDRFLPEEVAKRPPGCYLPFSLGPRNCIGITYGIMSMKTTLATFLRKYKTYSSYKSIKEIEVEMTIALRPKCGFKLSVECRR